MMEGTHTETEVFDPLEVRALDMEAEYDLPELADTMEEADARVAASRYLGAMRNVQGELVANEAEYRTLAAFQQRRHDERQGPLERQVDWLHQAVKTLFGFMHTGKKKSLNLIGGRVGMRSQTAELVVDDDGEVIAWALESPDYYGGVIKMKPQIDRKALRAHICEPERDPSIPMPPGVRLEARPDQFYATPAKD
jgi:hypothetical protein